MAVLAVYCCTMNYHEFNRLKQHMFSMSHFPCIGSPGIAELGFLFRVSRAAIKVSATAKISSGGGGPLLSSFRLFSELNSLSL